ncbi:MAG: hypothetical protein ABSD68_01115 [Candidatus Micrarchaeales archaeon]
MEKRVVSRRCPSCKGYGKINEVDCDKEGNILYPIRVAVCEECKGKGMIRKEISVLSKEARPPNKAA